LHVFPYSPRPGTPASRMPQVPKSLVKLRAAMLRQKGDDALQKLFDYWVGKSAVVLVESVDQKVGAMIGKTDHFIPVRINNASSSEQVCLDVNLVGKDKKSMEGVLITP